MNGIRTGVVPNVEAAVGWREQRVTRHAAASASSSVRHDATVVVVVDATADVDYMLLSYVVVVVL